MKETISVCLVTYNHEAYIAQAIESVLMQKVNAEVRLYIGEDCSTDGTRAICEEYQAKYPEIIRLVKYETNQGLVKNTNYILQLIDKEVSPAGYIAMLDGDDYWTDPNKLQMELDYFHSHPNYGLVHTKIDILRGKKLIRDTRDKMEEGDVFHLIENYGIGNSTVMFKQELLQYCDYDMYVSYKLMSLDYVMYAKFAKYTHFGYIPVSTAVWRRGHASVSNTNDLQKQFNYVENSIQMWRYLGDIFPERWPYTEEALDDYRKQDKFKIAFRMGCYEEARELFNQIDPKRWRVNKAKQLMMKHKLLYKLLYKPYYWLKE